MKYITDGENNKHNTKSGDDIATRTLYTLAKRRDRRNYFSASLIFLCVIFFLSITVGCLLYIYLKQTEALPVFDIQAPPDTFTEAVKTVLKNYFISFLPFALVFVLGFTTICSLLNGLLCAFLGVFAGFFITYMYKLSAVGYLSASLSLALYCFVFLYFSAVSVSFSHSLSPNGEFDSLFEEDLACYLRYLLTSASATLAACIIYHII